MLSRTGLGKTLPRLLAAIAIATMAASAYFWRLGWGLDRRMAFVDEVLVWLPKLRAFVPLNADAVFYGRYEYPPLFAYVAGLSVAALSATGQIDPPGTDPHTTILVARVVGAIAALVALVFVGAAATTAYGPRAGFLSAGLMAVVPMLAMQVHYVSAHPLLVMAVGLVLLTSIRLLRDGHAGSAALAGAAAGIAFAAKYDGLAFSLVPAWAAVEIAWRARSPRRLLALGTAALLGFLVAFLVACPPAVYHPSLLLAEMRSLASATGIGIGGNQLSSTLGWYGRPYAYQLIASLPYVLGWPLYAVALGGLALALWRREAVDRLLLISLLPFFAVIGGSQTTFPRYLLPLVPGLMILAGRALAEIPQRRLRAGIFALVWVYGASLTFSQIARFSFDQQAEVARWIEEDATPFRADRVPVGVLGARMEYYLGLAQPFKRSALRAVPVDASGPSEPTDYLLVPTWTATTLRRDQPRAPVVAFLDRLEAGETPFHGVASWHSGFVQQGLYTWLDPTFEASLYQGEIGFRLYRRDAPRDPR